MAKKNLVKNYKKIQNITSPQEDSLTVLTPIPRSWRAIRIGGRHRPQKLEEPA